MCVFSLTGLVNFNAWMIPSNFRVCIATCFGQVHVVSVSYTCTTILWECLHRVVLSTTFVITSDKKLHSLHSCDKCAA